MCRYCHQNPKVKMTPLKPERWKTLLAFLYVLLVSWVTAFVMVIVHDRVPDMEKYPPLPDIILDNVPHIPWVRLKCDYTGFPRKAHFTAKNAVKWPFVRNLKKI